MILFYTMLGCPLTAKPDLRVFYPTTICGRAREGHVKLGKYCILDSGMQIGPVIQKGRWENRIRPGCKLSMLANVDRFLGRHDRCFWNDCVRKGQSRGWAMACSACGLKFLSTTKQLHDLHDTNVTFTWTADSLQTGTAPRTRLFLRRIRLLDEGEINHYHDANYSVLRALLEKLQAHPSATPFLLPVDRDDEPCHYFVIEEPMDLSTMESKLESDVYDTAEDFIRDVRLILQNCRTYYNKAWHPFVMKAESLEPIMWQMVKIVLEWSYLEP